MHKAALQALTLEPHLPVFAEPPPRYPLFPSKQRQRAIVRSQEECAGGEGLQSDPATSLTVESWAFCSLICKMGTIMPILLSDWRIKREKLHHLAYNIDSINFYSLPPLHHKLAQSTDNYLRRVSFTHPRSFSGKEPARQCRRCWSHGFNPWVGKIHWRGKWQPTPVFLPGSKHGQRSPVGYSPWGCKKSDTTEQLNNKNKTRDGNLVGLLEVEGTYGYVQILEHSEGSTVIKGKERKL